MSAAGLITRYYDAFNAGDMDAMLTLTGIMVGAVVSARRDVLVATQQISDIVVMANDEDTRAAAEFVVHGEYLASDAGLPEAKGQRYVLRAGAFFEIREGRIARVTNYYNLEHWLQQVRS